MGHCAEMCGTYHSMMELRSARDPNDFKAYQQRRRKTSLRAINQPLAVTTRLILAAVTWPQPVG